MRNKLVLVAVLLAAALSFGACKKPDCQKAVDHAFLVMEKDLDGLPADQKKEVLLTFPKIKEEALADCKVGKPKPMSNAKYDCILASKVKADLGKCQSL